jgi:tryptophan halogenase
VRDFIILHYCATQRDDSRSGVYCAAWSCRLGAGASHPDVPRASHKLAKDGELFRTDSWIQVMLYQGIWPEHYHHLTSAMPWQT